MCFPLYLNCNSRWAMKDRKTWSVLDLLTNGPPTEQKLISPVIGVGQCDLILQNKRFSPPLTAQGLCYILLILVNETGCAQPSPTEPKIIKMSRAQPPPSPPPPNGQPFIHATFSPLVGVRASMDVEQWISQRNNLPSFACVLAPFGARMSSTRGES